MQGVLYKRFATCCGQAQILNGFQLSGYFIGLYRYICNARISKPFELLRVTTP